LINNDIKLLKDLNLRDTFCFLEAKRIINLLNFLITASNLLGLLSENTVSFLTSPFGALNLDLMNFENLLSANIVDFMVPYLWYIKRLLARHHIRELSLPLDGFI